jgi:hypothetical protein
MKPYFFSQADLEQFAEKGIPAEIIGKQIENFRRGFPPITLVAPATAGNGILRLQDREIRRYAELYSSQQPDLSILKFIPASGAATRMFKSLFEYLNESDAKGEDAEVPREVREFVGGLERLALTADLEEALRKKGRDLKTMLADGEMQEIVRAVLLEDGLNYGQLPKGLLQFHKYGDSSRTPLEEHMVEGADYCRGKGKMVNLHFTVSVEHLEHFHRLLDKKKAGYEKLHGVRYEVGFSVQRPFTDTLAVDTGNRPFRDRNGKIIFRPGGHGSLLANLDELEADLIFIKNIDNVCPDRMKPVTSLYKKALAGILLEYRDTVFRYIRMLDEWDHSSLGDIESFLELKLFMRLSGSDKRLAGKAKADLLRRKLNRPMRVCGMVRNEGEPGGGPFWALNRDGSVSLQIVESAQIDFGNEQQSALAGRATHFNPVDLVCATRDYLGRGFDLKSHVDPETGFISVKSRDGRSLKAQELPGLWNGSMSDWNTLFVEVPIETFNPVKTINDLLRPEHLT